MQQSVIWRMRYKMWWPIVTQVKLHRTATVKNQIALTTATMSLFVFCACPTEVESTDAEVHDANGADGQETIDARTDAYINDAYVSDTTTADGRRLDAAGTADSHAPDGGRADNGAADSSQSTDSGALLDANVQGEFPTGTTSQLALVRPQAAVAVNGDLDEWANAYAMYIAPSNLLSNGGTNLGVDDDSDANATVAMLYDNEYLYLAARVIDDDRVVDTVVQQEHYWWYDDGVAFFFDVDNNKSGNTFRDGDNVFAFRAVTDQSGRARWWRKGHNAGAEETPAPAEVLSSVKLTAEGYDLEVAIPWTLLSDNNMQRFPQNFGCTVVVLDPVGNNINRLIWVGLADNDDQAHWGSVSIEGYVDGDQDTWPAQTDCDDVVAEVHPFAIEIPANQRDDNCNGEEDEAVAYTILDQQRLPYFAEGNVSIEGNRFKVGAYDYFPKTDFLTAVHPGTNIAGYNTHCYLAQNAEKRRVIREALVNAGYNSIYVYTLNQGDYGGAGAGNVVTPYGTDGFSFDTTQLNATTISAWQNEIESLIYDHQLKPFLWLAADDSGAIDTAPMERWRAYVDDMVDAFEAYPIVWVVGLEVDEYWSAAEVSERRAYLQSQTQHPVGVHLTTSETRNTGSHYKDNFDFIMVQFNSPQSNSQYISDVNNYVFTDRPYLAAEFNVSGTGSGGETAATVYDRSRAIGRVIADVGQASKVSGIGNGIRLP